jgi:hypothetical protein
MMQLSRIGIGLVLGTLLTGNVWAQKVTTDYDKGVDFSKYKTYMWIKEPKTTNPLVQQRILDDVNAALSGKGLKAVSSDADLAVAAHASTKQEQTLETFYDGFGGGWRWRGGGFGTATTSVQPYQVGTLVVDLFDARTKDALWRAASTKTLSDNPKKNAESLNKAVTKMFKDFPPSSRTRPD